MNTIDTKTTKLTLEITHTVYSNPIQLHDKSKYIDGYHLFYQAAERNRMGIDFSTTTLTDNVYSNDYFKVIDPIKFLSYVKLDQQRVFMAQSIITTETVKHTYTTRSIVTLTAGLFYNLVTGVKRKLNI